MTLPPTDFPLLLLAVFAPLVGALLALPLARSLGRSVAWITAASMLPALALALRAPAVADGAVWRESLPWVPSLGLNLDLRLDGLSLVFAVLIGVMGVLTALYSRAYLYKSENFGRFFAFVGLFAGSMLGLVLSDNLYGLFFFWELTSITSFLLVGFWHRRGAARDGAMKALLVTVLGGLALLVGVVMISLAGGSAVLSQIDVDALRQSPLFVPATLLVLLGAFTKSAQLPFSLWLPTAMEAPTPVSAFLHSATMVKAGVFLVAKLGALLASGLWSGLTVGVGLATLCWGAWLALRQTDLKALLAYSTVSQLGLLMALYGLATPLATFAATAHLLNHAAFKAALFFVVGIVDHGAGTRTLTELGGLRRVMPLTAAAALVAALSMAGLPPLGGFISKELFYEAMLAAGPIFIAVAVAGSALTFAYSLRFASVFLGPLRAPVPEQLHEASRGLLLPLAPLGLAALAFGLVPVAAEALVRVAAPALGFAELDKHLQLWHGVNAALLLSVLTWVLGALVLWRRDLVAKLQARAEPRWNGNTVYYAVLRGLDRFAIRFTASSQGQRLPDQLRAVLSVLVVLVGFGLLRVNVAWPDTVLGVPLAFVPVAVLLVAGALGALAARDAVSAIVFTGLTGFGTAGAFLILRAPDLALTQLLIEAVTVILFLLALRLLPPLRRVPRGPVKRVWDGSIALGVGALVFSFLLLTGRPLFDKISPYYVQNAYEQAGGKNVVNVILVDFRGFDTLGEIAVLAIVAVAIFALVNLRGRP